MPDTKTAQDLTVLRNELIVLRNSCLSIPFDSDGAVLLSHTIRWLAFKIEGKEYVQPTD